MKKAFMVLAVIIILAIGAYFALQPSGVAAPTPQTPAQTKALQTAPAAASHKPPADVGAGGVYDPKAPAGSAAQCAACGQYQGSQKAQCLAALNCQY